MDLQEPLLSLDRPDTASTPARMASTSWPTQQAQAAKLYVPRTWPGGDDDDATCVLAYDNVANLLKVMSCQDDSVLDVIDPYDIIGADLEIKILPDSSLEPRAFRNAPSKDDDNADHDADACGIFKPIGEDLEKIFALNGSSCGEEATPIPYETQATAVLNLYCYPKKDPSQDSWMSWCGLSKSIPQPSPKPPAGTGHRYAHHRRFEVVPSEDFANVSRVVRAVRHLSGEDVIRGRKFLVLVNPKAGVNKAKEVYEDVVKPMLEQACIDHDVFMTESYRHAEEYMQQKENLLTYDAYVCMGGDGILHETIQGIKHREDAKEILKKLKLGVIGCGTGNGLAKSILHASEELYSHLESTFIICKGQTCSTDLSTYKVQDKEYVSFLTFTYAMIADVDIESEYIRCLGSTRFDVWAVWRTLSLRKYRAKFSYLPPPKDKTTELGSLPALTEPVPSDWITIEDDFVLFWASQVTHAAVNTFHAPPCKIQDGIFQILMIRGSPSKYKIIGFLLGLEDGTHINSSISEFIECVAYRLEPLTEGSFNDLDGEVIESGPIQAKVMPAAMQVYCKPQQQA